MARIAKENERSRFMAASSGCNCQESFPERAVVLRCARLYIPSLGLDVIFVTWMAQASDAEQLLSVTCLTLEPIYFGQCASQAKPK
jgi:hypothetical protein